ncbi:MAG: thioredoxin family protein [Bacteroidales bacterium]|nr:thioredoxin family protein [Bacteroidales bacterium]
MRKITSILFMLVVLLSSIWAQETPVTWNFKTVKVNDSVAELQFQATIQENWHLYSQYHNNGMEMPIEFSFTADKSYKRIGKVAEPKPIVHYDPMFNDTSKYFVNSVTFKQKVKILQNEPFAIKGRLSGQSCIDGRCVALDKKFSFDIEDFDHAVTGAVTPADATPEDEIAEIGNEKNTEESIENTNTQNITSTSNGEQEESLWSFFIVAFLGGLVGLLMPCVFPMIPMTVSYFMKSGSKAKLHALIYGLSIVVIYVIFGIVLSLIFGPDFANILSTHWIPNILFAIIFIIFALSFFGYFEITLPSSWVNKSAKMENTGGLIGIFFMALTLVLVSFSCTLPIAGAVALNSVGGSLLKPIIGMLGFSLGIAIPFTLFAFFPGLLKKMPKSGGWMNTLKVVLAFIELAFALKFINVPDQTYHWGILDREVYLALWIVLFSLMGIYLLGKIKFPLDDDMPVQKSPFRFMMAILTFAFVVYMIPGMFGAPLKAISGWLPPMTTQDFDINNVVRTEAGNASNNTISMDEAILYVDQLDLPHGIQGYFDYDQALRVAKQLNKPVFIDFTGHGCVNCRNVENAVWIDPQVRKMFSEEFVVVALYVDDKNIQLPEDQQLMDEDGDPITTLGGKNMFIQNTIYKENSQPCYFIVDTDGSVLAGPTYYEKDVNKYMDFLKSGIKAYQEKHQ